MTIQIILLIFLFPIALMMGKLITKNSEEEITEVRGTTTTLMKILIVTSAFIITSTLLSIITASIITAMILIHLLISNNSPQEKVLLAIIASAAIYFSITSVIILGITAMFLKGINMQNAKDKILTRENAIQVVLLITAISFKFIAIMIANMMFI